MPHKVLTKIKPRKYQQEIYNNCVNKNCLVVLPTGIGKTLIALMLCINRQKSVPGSKCLFLAPTRPLAEQHLEYFQKHLPELFAHMELFTGKINAEKRKELWQRADIIFSTPQCISNDLKNNIYELNNVSLLIEDECLTGDCKVKLSKGKIVPIKEIYENFKEDSKIFVDSLNKAGNIEPRKILKVHKISNKKQILEIITKNNKIKATEDHLLIVKKNNKIEWIKAKDLKPKDKIAANLKESNEKYKNKTLVNEKKIIGKYGKSIHQIKASIRTIKRLKEKKLLPLEYKNPRLKIIAGLIGYILGDGWFTKIKGVAKIAGFSGEIQDLKNIQRDLEVLEIKHTKIHSRKTNSMIKTASKNKILVKGSTNTFSVTDSCLIKLLDALETHSGDKTTIQFLLPQWLMDSPKSIKKEFLASLMACEGDTPKIRKNSRIPYAIRYRFNKSKKLKQNALQYTFQIQKLFKEFKIPSTIQIKKGNIRKDGTETIQIQITLSNSKQSFKNFLENISYKYNYKKIREANKILSYIRYKEKLFEKRKKLHKKIIELKNKGFNIHKAIQTISKQFKIRPSKIWNLGYSKEPTHTSWLVDNYDKWKDKNQNSNMNWEQVRSIKKIKNKKHVYDLTIEENHNYIANNLIVHNCHRCLKNYSYTYVAKTYNEQAENPRVLGLTASPGTDKKTITQIAENLGIEAIELRTRDSEDVKEYLQELKFNTIRLEYPKEFKEISDLIRQIYERKVQELKNRKLLFRPANKITLLELQGGLMASIRKGHKNFNMFGGVTACAQAIKISHLIELLETQTLYTSLNYMKNLFQQASQKKSKASIQISRNPDFNKAFIKLQELVSKNIEHPKLLELTSLIEQTIKNNPKNKTIVFSQYRDTVSKICQELNKIPNINAKVFVGQAKKTNEKGETTGLNQKEQQEIMNEFKQGTINIICATSIAEEGLDIPEVNSVIFYEPIPSAIRSIQRRGRTARLMKGKLTILMTLNTLDEIFYYASRAKEKRMYKAIETIKAKLDKGESLKTKETKELKNKQKTLF